MTAGMDPGRPLPPQSSEPDHDRPHLHAYGFIESIDVSSILDPVMSTVTEDAAAATGATGPCPAQGDPRSRQAVATRTRYVINNGRKQAMRSVVVVLMCLSVFPAYAKGGYVGISSGFSQSLDASGNVRSGIDIFSSRGVLSNASFDEHAPGAGVLAGYRFNDYIGLEAGFVYLGTYRLKGILSTSTSAPTPMSSATEQDTLNTLYAADVIRYSFEHLFSLFTKLGAAYSFSAGGCTLTGSSCPSYTTRNMGFMLGFGVGIPTPWPVDINIEYDQFQNVGNSHQYTDGNFYYANLNAVYKF